MRCILDRLFGAGAQPAELTDLAVENFPFPELQLNAGLASKINLPIQLKPNKIEFLKRFLEVVYT